MLILRSLSRSHVSPRVLPLHTFNHFHFLSSCRIQTQTHVFLIQFHGMERNAKRARSSAAASDAMIPTADFDSILEEMQSYDEQRERVIKRSRDIQKLSKQAIFSVHRGALDEADAKLSAAESAAAELLPLIAAAPTLRSGSFSGAIEEYCEAVVLRTFLIESRIPARSEFKLDVDVEEYLGGVLDFTGELNRVAVARATVRDKAAVQQAKDLVEGLMGQFLRFDFRNGAIRKKYDALKYTLKKLETMLYELSLTEAGLATKPSSGDGPEPEADGGAGDEAA